MFGLSKGLLLSLIAALFGVGAAGVMAYRVVSMKPEAVISTPRAPQVAPSAPAPQVMTPAPQSAAQGSASVAPPPDTPVVQAPADKEAAGPRFDVVRVAPSGETVVAGRAAPNTNVVLLNKGEEIARTKTDAQGQFVILPPALAPGDHVLALGAGQGAPTEAQPSQNVTVSVPQKAGGDTLVALTEPDRPTRVITDSAQPSVAGSALAIRTAEADESGGFFASGIGPAGATIRLYLNEIMVAAVQAGPDRQWSLKIEKGMVPGAYRVRADMVDPATGAVQQRAEAPFDFPERAIAGAPVPPVRPAEFGRAETAPAAQVGQAIPSSAPPPVQQTPAAAATPSAPGAVAPANAVVSEIQTVTVLRGDNLWRISRKVLGRGMRYTQIYEANAAQIRDPRRIYPKQIFVMPGAAN